MENKIKPKYTQTEIEALNEKSTYPEKKVVCPRCGKELMFREIGTSYSVKCQTANCLKANFRGI